MEHEAIAFWSGSTFERTWNLVEKHHSPFSKEQYPPAGQVRELWASKSLSFINQTVVDDDEMIRYYFYDTGFTQLPIRDPDPKVIKPKFGNLRNPRRKHKSTIDKVHLGPKAKETKFGKVNWEHDYCIFLRGFLNKIIDLNKSKINKILITDP